MSDNNNPKPNKIEFRKPQIEEEIEFRRTQEHPSDDREQRDNTDKTYKPQNVRNASPSPFGTVKIAGQRDVNITVTNEVLPEREVPVNLDRSDITVEDQNKGFTVLVRRDEEKSDKGIDGGHISRLTLTKGEIGSEEIFAHFESGEWIKEPKTFLENQIIAEAKERDNGVEIPDIEAESSKSREKSRNI